MKIAVSIFCVFVLFCKITVAQDSSSTSTCDSFSSPNELNQCNASLSDPCYNRCSRSLISDIDCHRYDYCCLNASGSCIRKEVTCDPYLSPHALNQCDRTSTNPCLNRCSGFSIPSIDCHQYNYCCLNASGSCVRIDPVRDNSDASAGFQVSLNTLLTGNTASTDGGARNFNFGGQGGIPFPFPGAGCPPSFPQNCLTYVNPQSSIGLSAPINVPYCKRIACNPGDPGLEMNKQSCLLTPGCYFDDELYNYRQYLGQFILPGVPVCHLVIRNRAFRRRADDLVRQLGSWNPLLTNCILNEFSTEIFGPHGGCDMIDVLQHFGHIPKLAGWSGITKRQCSLIGACWKTPRTSGSYCAYPMNSRGQITLRSNSISLNSAQLSFQDQYGLPECYPMSYPTTRSPLLSSNFLSDYHNCLSAGCTISSALDPNILIQYLQQQGSSLNFFAQLQYQSMVRRGEIRADNYKKYLSPTCGGGPSSFGFFQNSNSQPQRMCAPTFPVNFGSQFSPQPQTYIPFVPDCPFVQPNQRFPHFPRLSGSFEGCCDRPLCYIPKQDLYSLYSGISPYLSQWNCWSRCDVTCGRGFQNRTRECVGDDGECGSLRTSRFEQRVCNIQPC